MSTNTPTFTTCDGVPLTAGLSVWTFDPSSTIYPHDAPIHHGVVISWALIDTGPQITPIITITDLNGKILPSSRGRRWTKDAIYSTEVAALDAKLRVIDEAIARMQESRRNTHLLRNALAKRPDIALHRM